MPTRREFLKLAVMAGGGLTLPGCAASGPLPSGSFRPFGAPSLPFLGLATSLSTEYDYDARVEGMIPPMPSGVLYRNGPALFDRGGLRKRALLDGDGMVQAFTFRSGGCHYRNRFVRTEKYVAEERAGTYLYPTWSTLAPGGLFANFWGMDRLKSQAGVTVYLRNGRLYAFDESSLPYVLDPRSLATIGPTRLGVPDESALFSAHAKIDSRTGQWLLFGIQYGPSPRLHLTSISTRGKVERYRIIPLPRNLYFHDFFVSDRHLVFNLQPVVVGIWSFLLGAESLAGSFRWRPELGSEILVVPRGEGEPIRLSTEASFMWHSFNAYEEGGEIVAHFIGYENPDHFIGPDPAVFAVMAGRRGDSRFPGELRRYRIDLGRGKVRQEILDRGSHEWPRINDMHLCHRYRIGYVATCRPGEFFWSIISRIDLESGRSTRFDFGAGVYCGEPVFVPLPDHSYDPADPREPGWLLTEVYDSHTHLSHLAVLPAERPEDGPITRVMLRHHVPFSFHGFWAQEPLPPH